MLKFVSSIPIFRRLFLAFVLAATISGVVISLLGAVFIAAQGDSNRSAQVELSAVRSTGEVANSLDRMNLNFLEVTAHPPTNFIVHKGATDPYNLFVKAGQDVATGLAQFQRQYLISTSAMMHSNSILLASRDPGSQLADQQQSALNLVAGRLWPIYMQASNQVLIDMSKGQTPTARQLQAVKDAFTPLRDGWTKVGDITYQISDSIFTASSPQSNPMFFGLVIAILCMVVLIMGIGYMVNQTVAQPLSQLASLTRRIAKGETAVRARITGHDEISAIAVSMNTMLDHIVHLIHQTKSQRDTLLSRVEKLVSEVSGAGEGDLRIQAEVTADALGVLADSFNYMIEELASLVVHVKKVASEVETSTAAVLDHMTQLVEVADAQITQIADATDEVEVMASANRLVAEGSQHLHEVALLARQDAQIGRYAVTQAIEGMGRMSGHVQTTSRRVQTLGERSREINEIVDVISSIAHQTNRLALDAAIQAAMAGEHGKGFGAVAVDIRRLAERAKDQATQITRIVRSVREDIGSLGLSMQETERETLSGTRLTQEAGAALGAIFAAVENQAYEIGQINQMAVRQLNSSGAIVHIMHALSLSTQQTSASTRHASNNVQRLALLVEQLRSSVEAFKLHDSQGYYLTNRQGTSASRLDPEEHPMTVSGVLRTVSAAASTPPAFAVSPFASPAEPELYADVAPRMSLFQPADLFVPSPGYRQSAGEPQNQEQFNDWPR